MELWDVREGSALGPKTGSTAAAPSASPPGLAAPAAPMAALKRPVLGSRKTGNAVGSSAVSTELAEFAAPEDDAKKPFNSTARPKVGASSIKRFGGDRSA